MDMATEESMRLIMLAYFKKQKPGQTYKVEDEISDLKRLCQEAGLLVTDQELRREYRASAGFP